MTFIGGEAFGSCRSLTSVTVESKNPLKLYDKYTFSNRKNATLYVPAGSKAAYQAAGYWGEFKEIKEIVEEVASKVKLNKTQATIEKGKTLTLKVKVYPTTGDQSVTWKSSDKNVATVTKAGKVKAIGVGTAKITCTSVATGAKATCKVTVGKVDLSKSEATVAVGKSGTLKATVYPETLEDKSVTWKSSDTEVATVTTAGKVKAVGVGTAVITCTSNATGLKATCTLTVTTNVAGTRALGEDDDEMRGFEDMDMQPAVIEPFDVYDLNGRKVLSQVTSLDGLPNGIYIVNGKKILKK